MWKHTLLLRIGYMCTFACMCSSAHISSGASFLGILCVLHCAPKFIQPNSPPCQCRCAKEVLVAACGGGGQLERSLAILLVRCGKGEDLATVCAAEPTLSALHPPHPHPPPGSSPHPILPTTCPLHFVSCQWLGQ